MAWGGNTPFYYIPYYLFPGISKFRGPAMIFFLAAFSLVVLAGLGIDYLLRGVKEDDARKTTRTVLVFGAIPLALLLLFAALKGPMMSILRSTTIQTQQKLEALAANYPAMLGGLLLAAAVAALGVLLVRFFINHRLKLVAFAGVLAVVMILDIGLSLNLWNEQRGYIRGVPPPKEYFAPDEAVAFLKQDTSLYRVLPWHYERSDDGILAYNGIQSVAGQMPNPLQVYQDFLGAGASVMFRPDNLLNPNFMNLANIKYVISVPLPLDVSRYDEQTRQTIEQIRAYFSQPQFEPVFAGQKYAIYRNTTALPRAFVAPGFRVVAGKDELLGTLRRPDLNPARTVLLYEDPGFVPGPDTSAGTARVTSYDCNEVKVRADLTAPGLLVLTDCYVPDWKAYVDGKPAPVLQAFHTFRAVPLSAGQHDVVFKYESPWYRLGSYVSGVAVLLLAFILSLSFIRRRKP
ncbi:MAG: YfhO family protein, partial [candidate division WOR-3 bacterium]|nr:YfhO family protein [candidate division WOR-3 bacterium]